MTRPARNWSLVRRLTGGVALIALLSFGAQALVLALWLKPVADDVAAIAAEQAMLVRAALAAVPRAERPALAARLTHGDLAVSLREPRRQESSPWLVPPAEREMHLRERLASDIDVRFEPREGERFATVFGLPVEGQTWWLTREFGGPHGAVSGTLAIWLAMLALATVGALLVSVRLIAQPIGRLAAQIAAQKGLPRPLPAPGDASAELSALVDAFNGLAHQVSAAAEARQQLLAGVSHDLRTPLARLRLRAETQCEPPVAEALAADLLAMERIIDQFLAYVQGDAGGVLGVPEPLHDSVRDAVQRSAAAGMVVRARIETLTQPVPDLAVHRLLANLIDNAFAYGRAPVQVVLRAAPDGGAELKVCDHGPGMSDEEFERAQQPFVRLTRARSELGHCGLGLAIVAQIVRQLGGRLAAEREPGGAFGIAVTLPARGAAAGGA